MQPSVNFRKRALVPLPSSDSDSSDEPRPSTSKRKFNRRNVPVRQLDPALSARRAMVRKLVLKSLFGGRQGETEPESRPNAPEKRAESIKKLVVKSVVAGRQKGHTVPSTTSADNQYPQNSSNSTNCTSNRITYVHYQIPLHKLSPKNKLRRKEIQEQIGNYILAARRKVEGILEAEEEEDPKYIEDIRLKRFCDETVAMMMDRFVGENRFPLDSRKTIVLKFNAVCTSGNKPVIPKVSSKKDIPEASKKDDSASETNFFEDHLYAMRRSVRIAKLFQPSSSVKVKNSPSDTDDSSDDTEADTNSRLSRAADIFDMILNDKAGKIKTPKKKKRRSNQNIALADKYLTLGPNNTQILVPDLLSSGYTSRIPLTEAIRIITFLVFDRQTLATHSLQNTDINQTNILCPLKIADITHYLHEFRQADPGYVCLIIKFICIQERNRERLKQERKEAKANKRHSESINDESVLSNED